MRFSQRIALGLSLVSGLCLVSALSVGCGGDDGGGDGFEAPDSYTVSGTVRDFETGATIDGQASVVVVNLPSSDVQVTVNGANFEIKGIPPTSVFQLLVSAAGYQQTYSTSVEVDTSDVSDVSAPVVSTTYFSTLADDFGVTPSLAKGVLVARAVDETGAPQAGVSGDDLVLNGEVPTSGPYYLDADLAADPAATETSSSGYIVYFEVDAGTAVLAAASESTAGVSMDVAPTAGGAVTLADLTVGVDAVERPMNVSFVNDVLPIFDNRGCVVCHAQGGPGQLTGGLHLNGASNQVYKELTEDISPNFGILRIDKNSPPDSLLLTMPGPAADPHPNTIFASLTDPDYLTLLVWIEEGAAQN